MRVVFAAAARRELYRQALRYDREQLGKADRFLVDAEKTIALIKAFPAARVETQGVRSWPMGRFPYTMMYVVDGSDIRVLAVGHIRRGPRYWSRARRRPM